MGPSLNSTTRRRELGEADPATLVSIAHQGLLRARGDLAGAETYYRDVLSRRRRVLGDGHPSTLSSLASLGSVLHATGQDAEAVTLLAAAEADARAAYTGRR